MKRISIICLLICSLVMGLIVMSAEASTAYGNQDVQKEESARYTYFSNTSATFNISGSSASWTFGAKKIQPYDRAVLTAIVYKNSGAIMSRTSVYYNTNINDSKSLTLTAHGTYYVQFTLKCYKDGVLKETITVTSKTGTY